MITWDVGKTNIDGINEIGDLIYWTRIRQNRILCTVWNENQSKTTKSIAIFREKKGTRKPLL